MKIYDQRDVHGHLTGFEIDNWWLQPRGLRYVLRRLPGAQRLSLSGAPDERARFEVAGVTFQMFEPFGDSGRYLITAQSGVTPLLADVRSAFAEHKPSLSFRVAGVFAGASLLLGAAFVVAFRAGFINQSWVGVGLFCLTGGAMGFLLLVILAVLGLTGGTGASSDQSAVEQ